MAIISGHPVFLPKPSIAPYPHLWDHHPRTLTVTTALVRQRHIHPSCSPHHYLSLGHPLNSRHTICSSPAQRITSECYAAQKSRHEFLCTPRFLSFSLHHLMDRRHQTCQRISHQGTITSKCRFVVPFKSLVLIYLFSSSHLLISVLATPKALADFELRSRASGLCAVPFKYELRIIQTMGVETQ